MAINSVTTYLFFGGRCEEAIKFYASAVGAELQMLSRFDESPQPIPPGMLPAGYEKKVMHASFRVGSSIIMGSDGCGNEGGPAGFSLALTVGSETEADTVFAALSNGGKVTMPLAKTFWSPKYGQLVDRFGVAWMVMVEPR